MYTKFSYLWNALCLWLLITGVTALLTCLFVVQHAALADDTYGSGIYDNCGYTTKCPAAIAPITLPNGLKMIINLSNDQVIERSGYTIVITQLSGAPNVSFKSASISIDGKEAERKIGENKLNEAINSSQLAVLQDPSACWSRHIGPTAFHSLS